MLVGLAVRGKPHLVTWGLFGGGFLIQSNPQRLVDRQSLVQHRCLMVFSTFSSQSFWNYRKTCELVGAKYPATPLGLVTVAALLPSSWEVRLVDRNIEELNESDIQWCDIVFLGGMISQQADSLSLIEMFLGRNKVVVVGGPDATNSPHLYDRSTYLVLGEAEVTLPLFLRDYASGAAKHVYASQGEKADMALSPMPRFDLLKFENYLHVGIQFARGCPFRCEFCDIIELFGRVPRLKAADQVMAELQRLYDLGYRGHVDIVDDNFIGNKSAVKALLTRLASWIKDHNYPFEFTTEASINLANDEELLKLMQATNFFGVFVGVESPDEATLKATQKNQNTSRSIPESIMKIMSHGIIVNAGYIVGFDGEKQSVANAILDTIEATMVPVNMVGLLFALPTTQLAKRLAKEGRLDEHFDVAPDGKACQTVAGLNFKPLRNRLEILEDFYRIVDVSYQPARYFGRVQRLSRLLDCSQKRLTLPLRKHLIEIRGFLRLIMAQGIRASYRWHFWKTLAVCLWYNPKSFRSVIGLTALYLHFGQFRHYVTKSITQDIVKARGAAPLAPEPLVPGPLAPGIDRPVADKLGQLSAAPPLTGGPLPQPA